jgi:hypothetical protein
VTAGFLSAIALHEVDANGRATDPAIRAVLDYLERRVHFRIGETSLLFRFWMATDTYQAVSPIQSLIFLAVVKYYLTTQRLAYSFFPCAEADFWTPMLSYANLTRIPEADFEVNGRHYGMYGHDWRAEPPVVWLAMLAEKEVGRVSEEGKNAKTEPLVVLSEAEFNEAVRQALQDYTRPDSLASNLLLRSRLLMEDENGGDKTEALRALLVKTAGQLHANPRDEKLFRALERTYFKPAATQEAAAELLDLPFSTYRRHLTKGVQRLTEMLWEREITGK